jgi:hypothetical protein
LGYFLSTTEDGIVAEFSEVFGTHGCGAVNKLKFSAFQRMAA